MQSGVFVFVFFWWVHIHGFESPMSESKAHVQNESACFGRSRSYSREEVRDRHGGAGLVASLHSAVFAERDIESLVNGRLVGIIVIWQQGLLELALGYKGGLKRKERDPMRSDRQGLSQVPCKIRQD